MARQGPSRVFQGPRLAVRGWMDCTCDRTRTRSVRQFRGKSAGASVRNRPIFGMLRSRMKTVPSSRWNTPAPYRFDSGRGLVRRRCSWITDHHPFFPPAFTSGQRASSGKVMASKGMRDRRITCERRQQQPMLLAQLEVLKRPDIGTDKPEMSNTFAGVEVSFLALVKPPRGRREHFAHPVRCDRATPTLFPVCSRDPLRWSAMGWMPFVCQMRSPNWRHLRVPTKTKVNPVGRQRVHGPALALSAMDGTHPQRLALLSGYLGLTSSAPARNDGRGGTPSSVTNLATVTSGRACAWHPVSRTDCFSFPSSLFGRAKYRRKTVR